MKMLSSDARFPDLDSIGKVNLFFGSWTPEEKQQTNKPNPIFARGKQRWVLELERKRSHEILLWIWGLELLKVILLKRWLAGRRCSGVCAMVERGWQQGWGGDAQGLERRTGLAWRWRKRRVTKGFTPWASHPLLPGEPELSQQWKRT